MSTVTVEYHWAEPEPAIVAQRLISIAAQLEDLREPMLIAGELTRADIRENFETQTDPSGRPWDAWADSYEPWALAHGTGQILSLSTSMRDAVTSPGAYLATDEGLFLDTSDLPEWWAWNNFGAERATKSTGEDVFGTIGGSDNPLPERPFIGLSNEAKVKIDAAFALWFEGSIALGMSSRGKAFGRHSKRGAGGRFVKL